MLANMIAEMMVNRNGNRGGNGGVQPRFGVSHPGGGSSGWGALGGMAGNGGASSIMPGEHDWMDQSGIGWGSAMGGLGSPNLAAIVAQWLQKRNGNRGMNPAMMMAPGQGGFDPRAMQPSLYQHMGGMGSAAGAGIGRMF